MKFLCFFLGTLTASAVTVTNGPLTVVGPVLNHGSIIIGWNNARPGQPLSLWSITDLASTNWILAGTIPSPLPTVDPTTDLADAFQVPMNGGCQFFRLSQPAPRPPNHFVEFSFGLFLSLVISRILRP